MFWMMSVASHNVSVIVKISCNSRDASSKIDFESFSSHGGTISKTKKKYLMVKIKNKKKTS